MNRYYDNVNETIKDIYKGNINARLGAELKFNTFMFRLGGAYYGSPYNNENIQANKWLASGGLGYRNKGIFIDLTYSHTFLQDARFPYLLSDKANTYAEQRGSLGRVLLTLGFKI